MRKPAPVPARATAAALLLLLGLTACSREADDWRAAQAADTSTSYQQFLHQYPHSAHVNEANTRLAQLAEDEAWQGATSLDTQMGYQQFLTRYPDGKWAQEARVRVENFSLTPPSALPTPAATPAPAQPAAAPAPAPKVEAVRRPEKPDAPKAQPAAPKSVEPAAPVAPKKKDAASGPAASGVGVQLGAFSSKAKAEAAWSRLQMQFKDELGGAQHQIVAGSAGAAQLFRLRVPQASKAAARKLCERLKARNEVCIVYRP